MITSSIVMGILRHILTLVGGYLTAKFALEPGMIDGAIAAVVSLVGIVWSITSKTPYEPATASVMSSASTTATVTETPLLGLLGDPVRVRGLKQALSAADRAPYGYRKDGKPKAKPGKKR